MNTFKKNARIITIFSFLIIAVIALSGCGKKEKTVLMNELAEDNLYHYSNPDLGFSIDLPKEFEYYQTQSKVEQAYKSLQILVPTGDAAYGQMEVAGYAKPLEIRMYDKKTWDESADKNLLKQEKAKDGNVLAIKVWDKFPTDWNSKWTPEMEKRILDSFKLK